MPSFVPFVLGALVALFELWPAHFHGTDKQTRDRWSGPLLLGTMILGGGISLAWPGETWPEWLQWCGGGSLLLGLAVRWKAQRDLGRNYSYAVKSPQSLITRGIYRRLRHPAYTGTMLYALGFALLFRSLPGTVWIAMVLVAVLYRTRLEEQLLLEQFPDAYRVYQRLVKRFIPGVW